MEILQAGLDPVWPLSCGGCGLAGVRWCPRCAAALRDTPVLITPTRPVPVRCWALGRYHGITPHRRAVLHLKERGRRDMAAPLGCGVAAALLHLQRWGELQPGPLTLIPAPTRRRAARARGGDTVTAIAQQAARRRPHTRVAPLLHTAAWAGDSAGRGADRRAANLAGRVRAVPIALTGQIVLFDDVLTTGATAAQAIATLAAVGTTVTCVLVVAAA